MKTKLFIAIAFAISAIVITSSEGCTHKDSVDNISLKLTYCDIYSDWDEVIC